MGEGKSQKLREELVCGKEKFIGQQVDKGIREIRNELIMNEDDEKFKIEKKYP